MLTKMQKDVLTEILNVNIGCAASILSEIVNQKIILSVPEIDLQNGSDVDFCLFSKKTSEFRNSVLATVGFGQNFSGKAYIIIPLEDARELVNTCTGVKADDERLYGEDLDVIREISNVILNSLIGEFGNLLNVKLNFSFPEVELAEIDEPDETMLPEDMHFLTMYTSFYLMNSKVKGMIFVALSTSSEEMLLNKINEMLDKLND